jgi:protein arginine kinase activator
MICQSCEKKPATIHYTEIKGGDKTVLHLCEECAGEKGLTHGNPIPTLLASLVEGMEKAGKAPEMKCPECGITFEEFRAKGRLGCPKDYDVFASELVPLLEKVHSAKRHAGRLPAGGAPDTARDDRLLRLRRELGTAVKEEKYEDAARLRDEIRRAEESARGPR